jgi:hypothetical protein
VTFEILRTKHYEAQELATLELPDGTTLDDAQKIIEKMLEEDSEALIERQLDFIDNGDSPDYSHSTYSFLPEGREDEIACKWEDED